MRLASRGPAAWGLAWATRSSTTGSWSCSHPGTRSCLQALHRFWPPLVDFAGRLSADLAHPVQINAYITPKQSQGFSAHYDVHDVFVLQITGSKRWVIHDPVHPDPLPNQPWTRYRSAVESCAAEDPSADHVLEEGDVLYLPRGFIHSAEALGGISIHLTIGIHSHTRHDLVRSLLELAEEDPRLRRSLPLGIDVGDPLSWAPTSPPRSAALAEQIQAVPASDIAPVMARRSRGSTRPAPAGPLAQAQALEGLSSDTQVSLRSQQAVTIRDDGERVVLEHPGGNLTFAAEAGDALAALLSGDPIHVGGLPGLDDEEQLELVERLMRAGIVVAAGPDLESGT